MRRMGLLLKNASILRRNKVLKTKRKNNKCYVIGLGPSLRQTDLSKLDGDIIVTNRFYKIDHATDISPIAYVICDNDYFNNKHIEDFKEAVNLFPKTNFVLNGLYYSVISELYPSANNFYYLYLWDGFFNSNISMIDCCKVLPMSSNVICTALYLALYIGYEHIFLLGCDFNSFASQRPAHVYNEDIADRLWTMSDELFQYSFAADLHVQLNKYAKKHGQQILNVTNGSLIDAYDFDEEAMRMLQHG